MLVVHRSRRREAALGQVFQTRQGRPLGRGNLAEGSSVRDPVLRVEAGRRWARFDVPRTDNARAVLADLLVVADELQRIPLWVMEVQRADL